MKNMANFKRKAQRFEKLKRKKTEQFARDQGFQKFTEGLGKQQPTLDQLKKRKAPNLFGSGNPFGDLSKFKEAARRAQAIQKEKEAKEEL